MSEDNIIYKIVVEAEKILVYAYEVYYVKKA